MDDCNLTKLTVKPGELVPKFELNVTSYTLELPSNVAQCTLDLITRDSGASYSIIYKGGDGSKTIPFAEGEAKEIVVEVTAEDGKTTKKYVITASRLSGKDASLAQLQIARGVLVPTFNKMNLRYECWLGANADCLQLTAAVSDGLSRIEVLGETSNVKADKLKTEATLHLNYGCTDIRVQVTSPDGSNKQLYIVSAHRQDSPLPLVLVDEFVRLKAEDPFTLSPFHSPVILVLGTDLKRTYSCHFLQHLVKNSHRDPLELQPLPSKGTAGLDEFPEDGEMENEVSFASAQLVLPKGPSETRPLRELSSMVNDGLLAGFSATVTRKFNLTSFQNRPASGSGWEKRLCKIYDETDHQKLLQRGDVALQSYLQVTPTTGLTSRHHKFSGGAEAHPLSHLRQAIYCVATALHENPGAKSAAALHLRLATLLEEQHILEDAFGVPPLTGGEDGGAGGGGVEDVDLTFPPPSAGKFGAENATAHASAKEDEIQAICQLRGYAKNCSVALQLKALDEEYHALKEQGQSAKADAVQNLFLWKSQQNSMEGRIAQQLSSSDGLLGQAFQKYCTSLQLDESKALHHWHVGRLLIQQGRYAEAVARMESVLSISAKHEPARLGLGIALGALCLQQLNTSGTTVKEEDVKDAVQLLLEGWGIALKSLWSEACADQESLLQSRNELIANLPFHRINLLLIRGLMTLGRLLFSFPKVAASQPHISPDLVLSCCAKLICQQLPSVSVSASGNKQTTDLRSQLFSMLLECHSTTLAILSARCKQPGATNRPLLQEWLAWRAKCLNAVIEASGLEVTENVLRMQAETCKQLVVAYPRHSISLTQLGQALIAQAELESTPKIGSDAATKTAQANKANELLKESVVCLQTAIQLEGQPTTGETPPAVRDLPWFKTATEAPPPAEISNPAPDAGKAAPGPGPTKPAAGATRGGAAAGRGGGTAGRGGATATGKSSITPGKPPAPAAKGGAAPRGGGAAKPNTGTANKGGSTTAVKLVDPPNSGSGQLPPVEVVESSSIVPPDAPTRTVPSKSGVPKVNPKGTYLPRLALARAHRLIGNTQEALQFYKEVFKMEPGLHDAYLEAGELALAKGDLMSAVDVYCLMPFDDANLTFEDAFVFGEIVRLLMKAEKYDDPRLTKFMIRWGQVLGLGVLEKFIATLENKMKTKVCREVYAGVNKKNVDDPQLQAFFKMRMWI